MPIFIYLIYFNGEICGFIELIEKGDNLIISEIQFSSLAKGSKLILHTIDYIK